MQTDSFMVEVTEMASARWHSLQQIPCVLWRFRKGRSRVYIINGDL
jgi:hypothetical protein